MFIDPEEASQALTADASRGASIDLTFLAAGGFLSRLGGNPHDVLTQRAAVVLTVITYGGSAHAGQIRSGLRILLGVKGDDGLQALALGVHDALSAGLIVATSDGVRAAFWTPEALAQHTRAAFAGFQGVGA